jgi:hypothetical protein
MNSDWGEVFSNIVEDCDGIDETAETISVFPNPAQQFVQVEGIDAKEIQCYNALGRLVKTVRETNEVDLSGLVKGMYLLRITDSKGGSHIVRVAKE